MELKLMSSETPGVFRHRCELLMLWQDGSSKLEDPALIEDLVAVRNHSQDATSSTRRRTRLSCVVSDPEDLSIQTDTSSSSTASSHDDSIAILQDPQSDDSLNEESGPHDSHTTRIREWRRDMAIQNPDIASGLYNACVNTFPAIFQALREGLKGHKSSMLISFQEEFRKFYV